MFAQIAFFLVIQESIFLLLELPSTNVPVLLQCAMKGPAKVCSLPKTLPANDFHLLPSARKSNSKDF